ncbi:SDR family NAD(P)-dependent oxidoreductase [Rhodococcus sp. NPDC057014]|uniref:SDR family NAD(P)-dependent oxidoreductase n=1 Tax=Rhodococcus sp. NPDC057014 TaxID=3346000 RepID=UPI00362F4B16
MNRRPVAVVTGGTGGVGQAVCTGLASQGYDIAFTYHRNEEGARTLAKEIANLDAENHFDNPDLSIPLQADRFIGDVMEKFHQVDAVVHASGPYVDQRFVSTFTSEQFDRHVRQELTAFFELVRVTLPHLRVSGGSVTAVTTMALRKFPARDALSSIPKGGIEALIHALAVEEGRYGIRANAVGPGVLADGMGVNLAATGDVPPEMRAKVEREIPLRRLGSGADVAQMVCFLASKSASYVTGQVIDVDGGYSL